MTDLDPLLYEEGLFEIVLFYVIVPLLLWLMFLRGTEPSWCKRPLQTSC